MKKATAIISLFLFSISLMFASAVGASASPASDTAATASASSAGTVSPFITNPGCDTSPELFYTVTNQYGQNFCFANAGYMDVRIENVTRVCPGNNKGQVKYASYDNLNAFSWSVLRGPSGSTTCYNFSEAVRVVAVNIV